MSEDLIRRSDAIKHCRVWRDRAKEHSDRDGWWMANNLLGLIKDIPTIESKRGEWICHEGRWIDFDYYPTKYECNQCHHYVDVASDKNFCPNCGADMRGKNDE